MAVAWATIEAAISAWVLAASGLSAGHVYWVNTRVPEPTRPFIRFKRSGLKGQSGPGGEAGHIDHTGDVTPPPSGQELETKVVTRNTFTVSIQAFATPVIGGAQRTVSAASERTALDYLADVKDALNLPSAVDAMNAAGIAAIDASELRDIPESKDNAWSSRAQMDVTFNVNNQLSERGTYIGEVAGQTELKNPDGSGPAELFDFVLPT